MHDAEQVSESGWQEGGREDSEQVQHVDEQQQQLVKMDRLVVI